MKTTTKTTWTVHGWIGNDWIGSKKVHLTAAGGRLFWEHDGRGSFRPHRFESHDMALMAAQTVRLGPPDYVPAIEKTTVTCHDETVFLQDGQKAVAEDPGDKAINPDIIKGDFIAGAEPIKPASHEAMRAEQTRRFHETEWTVEAIQRETGYRMVLGWFDMTSNVLAWRPAGYPVQAPPVKFWSMAQAADAATRVKNGPPIVKASIRFIGIPISVPANAQVRYF